MKQTLAYLRTKFETGDKPTQDDFYDLLDSVVSGYTVEYSVDSQTLYSVFLIDTMPKVMQRLKLEGNLTIRLISPVSGEVLSEYTVANELQIFNIDLLSNIKVYALGSGSITYSYIGG